MHKKITTLALAVAATATVAVPGAASAAEVQKNCTRSAVSEPILVGNTVHSEGHWFVHTSPSEHVRFQIWKHVSYGFDEQVAINQQAIGNGAPFSADGPSHGHGAYYSAVDAPPYFPVQCSSDYANL